jgi:uncharacterized protein YciI
MPTYLVRLTRSGPAWQPGRALEEQSGWDEHAAYMDTLVDDGTVVLGGPLADDVQVALAVEAASEQAVRSTLSADPWSGSHLVVTDVQRWTIRLDGTRR